MTKDEKLLKIAEWQDIIIFLKECFPHHFTKDFAPFHREIFDMLQKHPRLAIAAPRGHAKTTIVSFGWVIWKALIDSTNHFTIIISNNYANAVKYLNPIKDEIEHNEKIKEVFGNLKSDKWSEDEIELTSKVKVICGGNDFKIRGQKYLQYRPDTIIIDDPEDDEMVRSKERRENFEHYILYALGYSLSLEKNQIVYIDTIKHRDSQLSKFLASDSKYIDWHSKKYQGWVKENEEPLWENLKGGREATIEYLQTEKLKDPYSFSQEIMNNPIPYEHALFKEDYFDNYTDDKLPKDLLINITVDLACTDKTYSDYTVVLPVGVDALGDLWILPYIRGKYVEPDDILDQMFKTYKKYAESGRQGWKFGKFGVEKVAFQRFLIKNFDRERKKRNLRFPIVEIEAKGDKVTRIAQLQPWFSAGDVHIRADMLDLKEELLDFPRARHDDIADALCMTLDFVNQKPLRHIFTEEKWSVTPEKQRTKEMNKRKIYRIPKVYKYS